MVRVREIYKSKIPVICLETREYVVSPLDPNSHKYKVFYDGEELKDVTAIVRINLDG